MNQHGNIPWDPIATSIFTYIFPKDPLYLLKEFPSNQGISHHPRTHHAKVVNHGLEDHPRTCKWVWSPPIYKPWFKRFGRGPNNPIPRKQQRVPSWSFTTLRPSWDDPPSSVPPTFTRSVSQPWMSRNPDGFWEMFRVVSPFLFFSATHMLNLNCLLVGVFEALFLV